MTIEEILKEHSLDDICKNTKITKENLRKIFDKDLSSYNKTKAMGLLSIIEREYGPVFELRDTFDAQFPKEESVVTPETQTYVPKSAIDFEQNSSGSKLVWIVVGLALLAAAGFMAFKSNAIQNSKPPQVNVELNDTNLSEANKTATTDANATDANETNATIESNATAMADSNASAFAHATTYQIVPLKKLWFGTFDMKTKAHKDYIVSEPFSINSAESVLIATSPAPFTLSNGTQNREYKDYKRHYFKVENGILSEITKEQFVILGGSKKW